MTNPVASGAVEADHHLESSGAALPSLSIVLHWATAVLVLAMFCTGVTMKQVGDGPVADALYTLHKTTGAALLCLVVLRLCYRALAHATGRWRSRHGSRPVHGVLYGGLILVPLLGLAGISDFGARTIYFGIQLPAIWPEGAGYADLLFRSHAWLAFLLIGFVVVHVGVALGDYILRGTSAGTGSPNRS